MSIAQSIAPRTISGRIAMCDGKKTLTAYRAFIVAAQMNRRKETKPKVRPYRCPVCGQHHVGSQPY